MPYCSLGKGSYIYFLACTDANRSGFQSCLLRQLARKKERKKKTRPIKVSRLISRMSIFSRRGVGMAEPNAGFLIGVGVMAPSQFEKLPRKFKSKL